MSESRLIAAVAVIVLASSGADAALAKPAEQHCVVHVMGRGPEGQLAVSEPACYPTFLEAMSAEGVDAWGADAANAEGLVAATFTIGIHYDGVNRTGSSMSVVGSDCAGGWLNVSAAWDNRISSTLNGCPRIRHYAGPNLTGATKDTVTPGGNLTGLDNQTSSIRYLT
jgi:hypothetical protein